MIGLRVFVKCESLFAFEAYYYAYCKPLMLNSYLN